MPNHSLCVARIGGYRDHVIPDLARRHRRAETRKERLEADPSSARVSLGRRVPEIGVANDLLRDDRLKVEAEVECRGPPR
jgi:hypothetical protein